MARNIKRVSHDLGPLSDIGVELTDVISQLLEAVSPHINFNNKKIFNYFEQCIGAAHNLKKNNELIQQYLKELNYEADQEGILK